MTRRKSERTVEGAAAEALDASHVLSLADRLRPWLLGAMTALFVARPLFPSESGANQGDGLPVVMLWIAAAIFWMLGAASRPKLLIRFQGIDAAVLLLMLCFTTATWCATKHGSPRPAINVFWEWIGMGLSFFLARQLLATQREGRALVAVMIGLAAIVSAYAIYQWAYATPHDLAVYDANPDEALRRAGLWFPPDSPDRKLFRDRLVSNLPGGTFALSNSLAGLLAPWLVVLGGVACLSLRGGRRLLGIAFCVVPLGTGLLLTRSRSGCIAAGLGVLLTWLLARRWRLQSRWRGFAAAAVVLAVAIALGAVYHQRIEQALKSFGYRLQYWQSTLRMIEDRPWLGCGPGNFQDTYTRYKLPEASEEVADPHNFLLEIWAIAGTPAAMAFLGVLGCFAWRAVGREKRGEGREPEEGQDLTHYDRRQDAWPCVLAGGLLGVLLSLPLGLLCDATPNSTVVLLSLPLGVAIVALLSGWIRGGPMPGWLPRVGLVVLLVNLLAAGGIGFPGVAGTFWLLLCVDRIGSNSERRWPGWMAWVGLATTIALAAVCYGSAYHPVLNCQSDLRMSEQREGLAAVEQLQASAEADRLSAEPWRRLAVTWFDRWRQTGDAAAFERFEQAEAEALRLAPNSASDWRTSGDRYFEAALASEQVAKAGPSEALSKALAAYRRAVELYPNSANHRASLAEACHATGLSAEFRREAEAALRLDQLTPHADKKLPSPMRNRLLRWLGRAN
ncbi:MAG: O-antigen ligase family protein [Thermoguttaceae bacterium]